MSKSSPLLSRILTSPFLTTYLPQIVVSNYAAGYTPRRSVRRWLCFLVVIGIYVAQVHRLWWRGSPISHTWVAAAAGGLGFWNCVTFFDRLLVRGWDYEDYPPAIVADGKPKRSSRKFNGSRTQFANEAIGSARGVGTWWEVKGVAPGFGEGMTMEWYCLSRGPMLVACWLSYNALVEVLFSERYGNGAFVIGGQQSFARELEVRVMATFNHFTRLYLAMNLFTMLGTIVTCCFDRSSLKATKPLFGSLKDAYTLRLFWG